METKKHIIKNFEALASSGLRKQALSIIEAGYRAIDTKDAMFRAVQFEAKKNKLKVFKDTYDLLKYKKIIAIGFGKASTDAAMALHEVLGERIFKGYFIGVEELSSLGPDYICQAGTHPLPSQKNLGYVDEMLKLLEGLTAEDLVICLVSGGGSALLSAPYLQSLEDEIKIFQTLTAAGATIQELNIVRKHTSTLKGGQLLKHIYPATCISLIFSDVPGDDISVVASGPTVKDGTSTRDALRVIEKYDLLQKIEKPKINLVETSKDEKLFKQVKNYLVVSSEAALSAMRTQAEELGFSVEYFSKHFQGNATELGKQIPGWLTGSGCLLGAGESTVLIHGQGKGGRNLEMALSALNILPEHSVFITAASDGKDNTEAAGAIVDSTTALRAKHLNLNSQDFLLTNDSFSFFEKTGDLLFTGPTGANVADFFVFLKK